MKRSPDDMRIACCLTTAEQREREATLLAQFRSAVIETEELRDGYAVAFRIIWHSVSELFGVVSSQELCGKSEAARDLAMSRSRLIHQRTLTNQIRQIVLKHYAKYRSKLQAEARILIGPRRHGRSRAFPKAEGQFPVHYAVECWSGFQVISS